MANGYAKYSGFGGGSGSGSGVSSLNTLTGAVTLVAGSGITLTPAGNAITIASTSGGGGTVTSVGLALPASVFSISGSPVTTAGTLTGAFTSQSANTIFAAPDGTSGTPTFRSLVTGDLPAGTGTVTSVSLVDSTGTFSITGSPITSSGTLTLSAFNSQAQHSFLAGPSGSSGAPTFRAIVSSDIPTLNQNTTGSAGSISGTNVITNSNLSQMPAMTIKANGLGTTADASDLTGAQTNLILPVFTSTLNGLVPASGGGTLNFLRADGSFAAPPGSTSGTVTSIAFSDGSSTPIYSITGSPITTAGTITETLNTQTANTVFAGPTTGSAAQPTFRALGNSDLSGVTNLSSLSLPTTQLTGTLQAAQEPAHTGDVTNSAGSLVLSLTATTNSTLTTLSALSLPGVQITGNISGNSGNVTGVVAVVNGGTSLATLTANNVILGNGTGAPTFVAPGTSGNFLQSNGTTWISSSASPGANTSLSNLITTSINQDLLPDNTNNGRMLGSGSNIWGELNSQDLVIYDSTSGDFNLLISGAIGFNSPSGATPAGFIEQMTTLVTPRPLVIATKTNSINDASPSNDIRIETGNKTGGGAANTGNIYLQTGGYAGGSSGTRGSIAFKDGSEGTSGYVWTSTDITGTGSWLPSSGGGGSGTVTSVAATVPAFLSISGSPITTSGTLAIGLSGSALPTANGGTNVTSSGTAGNVLVSDGTNWTSSPFFVGPSAFVAYASSQITTDSSAVTSGTFTTFDNSPAFTITPAITGTYKIYCAIPLDTQGTANNGNGRIFNTSGSATLLQESQSTVGSNGGSFTTSSGLAQSVYTLNAGVTYVFDIQGKVTGGTNILAVGLEVPFYMFAEGIGLTMPQPVAFIREEQAAGTNAGTFTSGSWFTRVLNTSTDPDSIIISLSGNQFQLAAGTYQIQSSAPAFQVDGHQTRLQNITDSSTTALGSVECAGSTNAVQTNSLIKNIFTITGTKTFEIQHQCETTISSNGFGRGVNFGVNVVYTEVLIQRLA
jgi:hypothetical protein